MCRRFFFQYLGAMALTLLAGCAGSGGLKTGPQVVGLSLPPRTVSAQEYAAARGQLASLPVPAGADAAQFAQLRATLDKLLADRASGKQPAALPSSQGYAGLVVTSGDGTFHLTWTYKNTGDYNSDGEVNISDLTPLGIHLRKTSASPDWNVAQAADGDDNGEVTVSDLTPIGMNLFAQVNGYNIYGGDNPTGPWALVDSVPTSEGAAGFPRQFDHDLTATPAYTWYALAPYDSTGADAVGQDTESPGALVQLGQSTTVDEQPMDGTGGSITAPVGSPIEGTTLTIPAGAFEATTQVSLGFNDGSVTFEHGSQLGSIIEIQTDYGQPFVKPITITVPVSTDPNTLPIPYYINEQGRLEPAEMTALDHIAGTMTFEAWHASDWIVQEARLDNPLREYYDTGFDPSSDSFVIMPQQGPSRLGHLAMVCFAEWYYRNAAPQANRRLRSNFMQDIEGIPGQYIIYARAHNSLVAALSQAGRTALAETTILSTEQRWLRLRSALRQGPQVGVFHKTDGNPVYVLIYAYVGNDVFVYDPSSGSTLDAKYNPTTHEVTADFCTLVNFVGTGSLPFRESFNSIYQDALRNFDGTSDADITIESHEHRQVVNESKPRITGKVESGVELVEELWFINRTNSLKAPAIAQVGTDGMFQVDLPLQAGENWFELVARGVELGGRHYVVSETNYASSEGFMLESTVQGDPPSAEPLLISIQRTTHLSDSLEDANMSLFVTIFDPDGDVVAGTSEGKVYQEPEQTPYLYSVPGYVATWDVAEGQWDPPWSTAWDGFGQPYTARASWTRNWGANTNMGYQITVYKNLVGEHPGHTELREDPEAYEWESIEVFTGSIAEPDQAPWDDYTGPGWGGDHTFTPTEPLQ
jgi:hypothetical protein